MSAINEDTKRRTATDEMRARSERLRVEAARWECLAERVDRMEALLPPGVDELLWELAVRPIR